MQLKFHHLSLFSVEDGFFQIWVAISTNAMSIVNSHIRQFKIICCWLFSSICFNNTTYLNIFFKRKENWFDSRSLRIAFDTEEAERERDIQRTIQKKVYFGIYIYIVKFNIKKNKVRKYKKEKGIRGIEEKRFEFLTQQY